MQNNADKQAQTMARNICTRGEISLTDDSKKMQLIQVLGLDDELLDGVERFQNYGLSSYVPSGGEAVLLSVGADRSHTIAIVCDDRRYRIKSMKEGEVVLYTDEGDFIHLMRNNKIAVQTKTLEAKAETVTLEASTSVIIDTPSYTVNTENFTVNCSNSSFNGGIATTEDVVAGGISLQSHVHSGVIAGDAHTGSPVGE